jgi:RHS repeat-associated protein
LHHSFAFNGLYHFGQRYYDPTTGQWTQRDPLDAANVGDAFGFGGGDPINESDPSGELPIPSARACVVMAFLAFCEMNGSTDLQDQVERTTPYETSADTIAESAGDDAGSDFLEYVFAEIL